MIGNMSQQLLGCQTSSAAGIFQRRWHKLFPSFNANCQVRPGTFVETNRSMWDGLLRMVKVDVKYYYKARLKIRSGILRAMQKSRFHQKQSKERVLGECCAMTCYFCHVSGHSGLNPSPLVPRQVSQGRPAVKIHDCPTSGVHKKSRQRYRIRPG